MDGECRADWQLCPPSGIKAFEAYYLDQQQQRLARIKRDGGSHTAIQTLGDGYAGRTVAMVAAPRGELRRAYKGRCRLRRRWQPLLPPATAATSGPSAEATTAKPGAPKPPSVEQILFRAEADARLRKQLHARVGFVERLVAFWSNHFAVSVAKSNELRVAVGPFEREAIRPYVLGKFSALLRAAESHPAMILYLDNQNSIGPDATPGKFAGRGLTRICARDSRIAHAGRRVRLHPGRCHRLARILTGWSVAGPDSEAGQPGEFLFKPNWHEPGVRKLLGKTYAENGVDQGRAALDDLALQPATARHIATKLARHFVADNPPADLIETLTRKFLASEGDLAVVASTLVSDDRAWSVKPAKIRTPLEFVIAAARVTAFSRTTESLSSKPQPARHAALAAWRSERLFRHERRLGLGGRHESPADLAAFMAQRMRTADPLATLNAGFGETASTETRQAVERAESREQALALLFMAPEFQRR